MKDGEEAPHAMANAYTKVIADQPERLMMQMQTCVAVAEKEGDRMRRLLPDSAFDAFITRQFPSPP